MKCCQRCNRIDALASPPGSKSAAAWPPLTMTVDGAVIRRRDALSGEWQYGWRVRDASAIHGEPGDATSKDAARCPIGPA